MKERQRKGKKSLEDKAGAQREKNLDVSEKRKEIDTSLNVNLLLCKSEKATLSS